MVVAIVLCSGLGVYFLMVRSSKPSTDPLTGSAIALGELAETTKALQTNFNTTATTKSLAQDYIRHMEHIEEVCRRIGSHQREGSGFLKSDDKARIAQADALCEDLAKLAASSRELYVSIEPLLEADTTPRRYELMPPLAKRTRQRHETAIKSGLDRWNRHQPSEDSFPTAILPELKQLQTSVDGSKGLSYLPALRTFQQRLLGERQQYWLAYADLPALQRSLTSQLNGFCQSMDDTVKLLVKECRQ
jgi:hypothetical protein